MMSDCNQRQAAAMTDQIERPVEGRGTEFQADEDRRRYREKIARITLDSLPQFVWLLDAHGTILESNRAALAAIGAEPTDVEGQPIWVAAWWQGSDEIKTELRDAVARSSRGESVRWETRVSGYAGAGKSHVVEISLVPVTDDDGLVIFLGMEGRDITERVGEREVIRERENLAEVHEALSELATMTQPLTDPAAIMAASAQLLVGRLGVDRCAYAQVEDESTYVITDSKRAEESLAAVREETERRRRLYETILSNTPDFVYVFDLNHRFVYANEILLKMWGKTWDEAIGKNCLELGYEPWHAAMHSREIEQVVATKQPIRGEVPFAGTFGRRIYDYIFVPVIGIDGEVEAIAGTTRDVTDRKEMEEELRDTDRRKDDFIALLAHELRNPLASTLR